MPDRLTRNTWLIINEPVQYRCVNILVLIHTFNSMLDTFIFLKIPALRHLTSTASVSTFLLGIGPFYLPEVKGDLFKG